MVIKEVEGDKTKIIEGEDWIWFPDIQKKIHYDGFLKPNLGLIKRSVKHDRDCVAVIAGDPGSGKSVFTMQLAKAVDPSFDETRVYFSGDALVKALIDPSTPKYTAFVYDEAREGLSARNSMSIQNKIITDCLAEIRQKNLFLFVVLPDFWDLDSNVANKRSRYLFYVEEKANPNAVGNEDPFERGHFRFYNRRAKYKLYILGKKFHDIDAAKPSFFGTFYNQYVVDEKSYREHKLAALRTNRSLDEDGFLKPGQVALKVIMPKLHEAFPEKTDGYWADMFERDRSAISKILHQYRQKGTESSERDTLNLAEGVKKSFMEDLSP